MTEHEALTEEERIGRWEDLYGPFDTPTGDPEKWRDLNIWETQ